MEERVGIAQELLWQACPTLGLHVGAHLLLSSKETAACHPHIWPKATLHSLWPRRAKRLDTRALWDVVEKDQRWGKGRNQSDLVRNQYGNQKASALLWPCPAPRQSGRGNNQELDNQETLQKRLLSRAMIGAHGCSAEPRLSPSGGRRPSPRGAYWPHRWAPRLLPPSHGYRGNGAIGGAGSAGPAAGW